MKYLLLIIISIIIYTEVLPTLSVLFEFIRTWLVAKITIIQQYTLKMQDDIQDIQEKIKKTNNIAIGFHTSDISIDTEKNYE